MCLLSPSRSGGVDEDKVLSFTMSKNNKRGARHDPRPNPSEGGSSQKGSHASGSESSESGNRQPKSRKPKSQETKRSHDHKVAKGFAVTVLPDGTFEASMVDPSCSIDEGMETIRQLRAEQLNVVGVVPDDTSSEASGEGVEDPKDFMSGPGQVGDEREGDDVLAALRKPYPVAPWNGQWSLLWHVCLALLVLLVAGGLHLTLESFRLGRLVDQCRSGARTPLWHEHGTSMVSSILGRTVGNHVDWALYRTADMYAPWYNRVDLVAQGHNLRDLVCVANSYIPWTTPCDSVYVPGPQAVLVASYVARYESWWATSGEAWTAYLALWYARGMLLFGVPWWWGLPLCVVSLNSDVLLLFEALYSHVVTPGTTILHPLVNVGRLDACTRDSYRLYVESANVTIIVIGCLVGVVVTLRGIWVAYHRRDCLMAAMVAYARDLDVPAWWGSCLVGAASVAAACDVKNTEEDARFATSKAVSLLTARRKVLDLEREKLEIPPIVARQWDNVRLQLLVSFAVKNRVHSAENALNFQGFHDPKSVTGFIHRWIHGSGEVATY